MYVCMYMEREMSVEGAGRLGRKAAGLLSMFMLSSAQPWLEYQKHVRVLTTVGTYVACGNGVWSRSRSRSKHLLTFEEQAN